VSWLESKVVAQESNEETATSEECVTIGLIVEGVKGSVTTGKLALMFTWEGKED
jgi:hypothetical protein